jgi:hypothetical protein
MIRILAASISAAALIAASLPANAQSHQGQQFRSQGPSGLSGQRLSGQPFRNQGPTSFSGQRFSQPTGQRNFRSFNPPAPGGQGPGRVNTLSRGLTPPGPGAVGTSQRSFSPQPPTGGRNFVGGPGSVPASLPAPSFGQSTPTAAPGTPGPQQTVADPGQPADAPQGDLQAPIPQTVTAQGEPMPTDAAPEAAPTDAMPDAEDGERPTVGEARKVVKVVPRHVVRHHGYVTRVVEYYPVREVYVPAYHFQRVYRHHHGYHGHRFHSHAHHGYRHHGHHGHRRW